MNNLRQLTSPTPLIGVGLTRVWAFGGLPGIA